MVENPTQSDTVAGLQARKLLGKRLRALRNQKGLTQGDIEKRTGLLRGHVSRLENGHVMPSLETLQRYADALQMPLYVVFYTGWAEPGSREVPEAALKEILEPHGEKSSPLEEAFLRKLNRLSARLTDADRELLLMMARKIAGVEENEAHPSS